jgi:hypothetical protein
MERDPGRAAAAAGRGQGGRRAAELQRVGDRDLGPAAAQAACFALVAGGATLESGMRAFDALNWPDYRDSPDDRLVPRSGRLSTNSPAAGSLVQTLDRDEISIRIDARPDHVYALVSDVRRTPEFSPEIVRCDWLKGASGPLVGARFEAVNKVSRGPSWKNRPVVLTADPGRTFSFSRTEKFTGTLVWRYDFEPSGAGTRVVESYEVTRRISRTGWFIVGVLFGSRNRRQELRAGMEQTLQRLKETAERETKDVAYRPS